MDQSETKEGNSSENVSESMPMQPPRKEKKMEDQHLEKAIELLTAFSNQTVNDECQHFENMIAAKLRNYNDTIRRVIQNEIISIFLIANRGLYEHYHHTHLQPINPPQAHFPSGPSKMYPHSINPPHTSLSSLGSQNPFCHVLETLLRHHSFSTVTHFCLTVFPQKAFCQLHLQKKIYRCL